MRLSQADLGRQVGVSQATIDKINGLPQEPDFIIHTGDLSHTSKAGEYDTLDQVLKGAKPKQVFLWSSYNKSERLHPMDVSGSLILTLSSMT